jgi:FKBP-type peptidyl-prolyl cis-trans isomerase FklB
MKNNCLIVLFLVIAFAFGSCTSSVNNVKLKTKEDTLAYAFGIVNYYGLAQDSIDLNPMAMAKAMQDAKNKKQLMEDTEARNFIMSFINKREALKAEQKAILDKELYKDYIAQNQAFLDNNKKREGVITTPSGLQYEVIKMGTGPKPTAESTVRVHYVGTLIDGTEFDSSVKRGQPVEFPVIGVIPGWTEALQLMPVGSKFKLYIPENLGYGAQGAGEVIKPYSTLIFEVELLDIVK